MCSKKFIDAISNRVEQKNLKNRNQLKPKCLDNLSIECKLKKKKKHGCPKSNRIIFFI